jgi:hypothetical protein
MALLETGNPSVIDPQQQCQQSKPGNITTGIK